MAPVADADHQYEDVDRADAHAHARPFQQANIAAPSASYSFDAVSDNGSDCGSNAMVGPGAGTVYSWNSDDEPPSEDVGEEYVCSRDKLVTRRILVNPSPGAGGKDRPGGRDRVLLEYANDFAWHSLGGNALPLGIELAVRKMRKGEICEVRYPKCEGGYGELRSPCFDKESRKKCAEGKPKRKQGSRAEVDMMVQTANDVPQIITPARADGEEVAGNDEINASSEDIDMEDAYVRAEVALVDFVHVEVFSLTSISCEDRELELHKEVVEPCAHRLMRKPRDGDAVEFVAFADEERTKVLAKTSEEPAATTRLSSRDIAGCLLQEDRGDACSSRVEIVDAIGIALKSMRAGEFAKVDVVEGGRGGGTRGQPSLRTPPLSTFYLRLDKFRRFDLLSLPEADAAALSASAGAQPSAKIHVQKTELRSAPPEFQANRPEAGGWVLAAIALDGPEDTHTAAAAVEAKVCKFRVGSGVVPEYLETVCLPSMALFEDSVFEMKCTAEGATLRQLHPFGVTPFPLQADVDAAKRKAKDEIAASTFSSPSVVSAGQGDASVYVDEQQGDRCDVDMAVVARGSDPSLHHAESIRDEDAACALLEPFYDLTADFRRWIDETALSDETESDIAEIVDDTDETPAAGGKEQASNHRLWLGQRDRLIGNELVKAERYENAIRKNRVYPTIHSLPEIYKHLFVTIWNNIGLCHWKLQQWKKGTYAANAVLTGGTGSGSSSTTNGATNWISAGNKKALIRKCQCAETIGFMEDAVEELLKWYPVEDGTTGRSGGGTVVDADVVRTVEQARRWIAAEDKREASLFAAMFGGGKRKVNT
eukprot:g11988.t1